MATYQFRAKPTSLRLKVDESGWCSVQLVDSEERYIGADLISIICGRLRGALTNPGALRVCGKLNGTPVGWVTALSEHVTLYATVGSGQETILYFQDANLNVIGTVRLSAQIREEWCRRLNSITRWTYWKRLAFTT